MRIEIVLFIITSLIVANIYTEGKIIKNLYSFKKYYKMIGVILGSLFLYFLIRKNPMRTKELLTAGNEYVKYLPLEKNTSDFISPILDFTTKQNWGTIGGEQHPTVHLPAQNNPNILKSGGKTTKRSVSETKKKFISSRQGWKCGHCKEQLNHTYEIDHIIGLHEGGSNNIDNLISLCRNCHGIKTSSSFL
jgi:hypothetical protein